MSDKLPRIQAIIEATDWKDCEHIFSNGTEFEIFYGQCLKCTRFRNEKCRILQRIFQAMWDKSKFPYKDLQDHVKYGGKRCRSFTTEKTERHKKPFPGQISMFEGVSKWTQEQK